jgi:hypothetical protein
MKWKPAKRTWALLALLAICIGLAVWAFTPTDDLAEFKESTPAEITPEVRATMDKAFTLIARNDMSGLFRDVMYNTKDSIDFGILYSKGIFAQEKGPFCPAFVVGTQGRSLVKSSLRNIRIVVHSEPRGADYHVALAKHPGSDEYKIVSIHPADIQRKTSK